MKVFVKKTAKRIKSGRILLQKPFDSSSNEKKNSPAHVNIRK